MTLPTWSHCIPTLNRIDILEQAVRLSVTQTWPPVEIIIVDASDEADQHRDRIKHLITTYEGPQPDLVYLHSPVRSLTRRRNMAIERARGEILFLFDDDTLMFPTCAEEIVRTFAADPTGQIAAAMPLNRPDYPGQADIADERRKVTGSAAVEGTRFRDLPVVAWIWGHVFMMSAPSHFIAYDTPRRMPHPDMVRIGPLHLLQIPLLSGFAMTVRASVAHKERFDDSLLSYCPAEDLDASYRFSRHGMNVLVETAQVHHFEAAAGRIRRRQAITLGLMNLAVFVAKHSRTLWRDIAAYYLRYVRRLLAEFLKDGLSLRFTFPQFLGALAAFVPTIAIFRHKRDGFDDWYRSQQMRVLGWATLPPNPAFAPNDSSASQDNKG
ncbi:MAG: glycosyltransferase family A protein [Tabrizicola sp.]